MHFEAKFNVTNQSFTPKFSESEQTFQTSYNGLQTIHGKDGKDGKSAYEIAADNGYKGTEAEWLESLHGKDGVDGKDGYTPIKGKDYFDGIDGKPGSDGLPGKEGYTPVKGVDYFDGKDGKDGKDGYTPQKNIDYFDGKDGVNGKDGKDGRTPVKGEDYFTADDKAEMVEAVTDEIESQLGELGGGVSDVLVNGSSIVNEDGVATIPIVTSSKGGLGLLRVGNSANGVISVGNNNGQMMLLYPVANSTGLTQRKTQGSQYSGVVASSNFDNAVRIAMTDGVGAAWTEDEQAAARARMGAVSLAEVLASLPIYNGEVVAE